MQMQLVQKPIADLFGAEADKSITIGVLQMDTTHQLGQYLTAHVPAGGPYMFRRELLRDLLAWWNMPVHEPLLLVGPTGCGKSSLLNQFASRINTPVWRITGNEEMELQEIFGHFVLDKSGSTVFMDGPLTQAARYGGIFLFDEIDRLRPSVAVGLNGVLEGGSFTLSGKGGEVVTPHPSFRIVATANSNMAGDETGNYNTAQIHDKSVLERFGMIVEVDYADDDQERALLAQVLAPIPDDQLKYWFAEEGLRVGDGDKILEGEFVTRDAFINGMLQVRKMVREQSIDGGSQSGAALERTMSTRSLLRWCNHAITFRGSTSQGLSSLHYALKRALTNGCSPTTKTAIHHMVKSVFGVEETV